MLATCGGCLFFVFFGRDGMETSIFCTWLLEQLERSCGAAGTSVENEENDESCGLVVILFQFGHCV